MPNGNTYTFAEDTLFPVDIGNRLNFSARPAAGHTFSHWEINGTNALLVENASPGTSGTGDTFRHTLEINTIGYPAHFGSDNILHVVAVFLPPVIPTPIPPGPTPTPSPRNAVNISNYIVGTPPSPYTGSRPAFQLSQSTDGGVIGHGPDHAVGTTVTIVAGFKRGLQFSHWDFGSPTPAFAVGITGDHTASFIMPSHQVNVRAVWHVIPAPVTYLVTINHNPDVNVQPRPQGNTPDGQRFYPDERVELQAGTRPGYDFVNWTISPSGTQLNSSGSSASFIMPDNNVTITANWAPSRHNVSITHLNVPQPWPNATVDGGPEHPVGSTVTIHPGPPPAGFTFGGWNIPGVDIRNNGNPGQFVMPNHNVVAQVIWVPEGIPTRDVIIYPYEGAALGGAPQQHPVGSSIPLLAGTRVGYTFVQWQVRAGSENVGFALATSNSTTFIMPPGTTPIRVEAVWSPIAPGHHTVTLLNSPHWDWAEAINHQSMTPLTARTDGVTRDTTVTLVRGDREGYDWAGWTSVPFVDINASGQFTMPDFPVIITANWTRQDAETFAVNINNREVGSSATLPLPNPNLGGQTTSGLRHVQNAQVPINAGTRPGHVFSHWYIVGGPITGLSFDATSAAQTFGMPGQAINLIAYWIPAEHTITLLNTPPLPVVTKQSNFTNVNHPAGSTVTITHGSRTGYNLVSFTSHPPVVFTTPNGATETTFTMPDSSIIIWANWAPNNVPVHQVRIYNKVGNINGANLPNPAHIDRQTTSGLSFAEGHEHVTVDAGSVRNFYFVRWEVEPSSLIPQSVRHNSVQTFKMPSDDVILTAIWNPVPTGTQSVSINNSPHITSQEPAVAQGALPDSHIHEIGSRVHVFTAPRPGYTFTGWTISPAFVALLNPTLSAPAGAAHVTAFDMPDVPVTITANWTRTSNRLYIENTPAITNNVRPAGQTTSGLSRDYGSYVTIYAGNRPGFNFVRWAPASAVMDSTNPHTTLVMPNSNLTVTAHWAAQPNRLDAPINISISGTTVSWSHVVPNAVGYRIYVGGQPVTALLPRANGSSFNLNNLVPNLGVGTHMIQVRAIGDETNTTDSDLSVARSFVVTPPATADSTRPTGLSIVNSILRWNPVMGATRYYIYVNGAARATINVATTATFDPARPSFDLSTINNPRLTTGGAGYDIQVRAVVGTLRSNLSDSRRFYSATPPLGTPRNVRIVGNPTLMWDFDPNPNLVGFRIYVNGQAGPLVGPEVRSYPIANLNLVSGTYLIGVRAIGNGSGNTDSYISTFVQYVSSTLPALSTPIGLNIAGNTLTWNAVPNAVGYRIYVNGQPSTAGIIGGLSFNLNNLNLGLGTHLIQVRAIGNNTTHTDSAISAFVSHVIGGGQVAGITNPTPAPRVDGNTNASQHVVTFNPGQGTFPAGEDGLRMGADGFVINSFTNTPSRAGYTFGGWQVGGTPVSFPLTVSGDMTLNAIWNRIDTPATPTPAPAGTRPNPQTGAFGWLNIIGVVVLTGAAVIVAKKLSKKGESTK